MQYEELDIMKMEMPPAFRGYGKKGNTIENPLSQKRQDEIDKIKESKKESNRYEIQDAIMPYELQDEYKKVNERIGVAQ